LGASAIEIGEISSDDDDDLPEGFELRPGGAAVWTHFARFYLNRDGKLVVTKAM